MSVRNPTLTDIAKACAVSIATVSKALSPHADRSDVSAETSARIRDTANALGWKRTDGRRERARKQFNSIGLLWNRASPATAWFTPAVFSAVADALAEHGQRAVLIPILDLAEWRRIQQTVRIDGAIAFTDLDWLMAEFLRSGYPIAMVNTETPGAIGVTADDAGGAGELGRHLYHLGHRRIVYIARKSEAFIHASEHARPTALTAAGLTLTTVAAHDMEALVAACRNGATAVVCYSSSQVIAALEALRQAGLAIPAQVSFACCDNASWLHLLTPAVTAVEVPLPAMAGMAAHLLARHIAGHPVGAPPAPFAESVIVRKTTAPART